MAEVNVPNNADLVNAAIHVQELAEEDGQHDAPINIDIKETQALALSPLSWFNYHVYPKKMKITNTGQTVIISCKWGRQRPFIKGGPLLGRGYVFSQLHFHWGSNDAEGSEHTVEGRSLPMEMHVVHFKSAYLTQESALKEKDGIVIMVYLFKLQYKNNPEMEVLASVLPFIRYPQTSAKVDPLPISFVVRPFDEDYFLYWGSIKNGTCAHLALWFVCRYPIPISNNQLALFRSLSAINHQKLLRNFRQARPLNSRYLFHVLPSKWLSRTLHPVYQRGENDYFNSTISQVAPTPSPFGQGDTGSNDFLAYLDVEPVRDEEQDPDGANAGVNAEESRSAPAISEAPK